MYLTDQTKWKIDIYLKNKIFKRLQQYVFTHLKFNPYCYESSNPTKHHMIVYNQPYQLMPIMNLFSATLIIFQWFIYIFQYILTLAQKHGGE